MAGEVAKERVLINPGNRKRKNRRITNNVRKTKKRLTLKQKLHFGTARQRVAAKLALKSSRGSGHRKRTNNAGTRRTLRKAVKAGKGYTAKARYKMRESVRRSSAPGWRGVRHKNVGEILSVALNSGTKRKNTGKRRKVNNMAKSRKRVLAGKKAARTRARRRNRNPGRRRAAHHSYTHRRRTRRRSVASNPSPRRRYSRRRNTGYHRRRNTGRRRNPGMLGGAMGKAVGFIGGAAITKIITDRLPAALNTGFIGYISTALVALVSGKVIGKIAKSASLGTDMVIGGMAYLVLRVIQDMFPNFANSLPFGLKGMGLIAPSNFYTPQVNLNGSMSSFVRPAGVPAAIPVAAGMRGLGNLEQRQSLRRVGRMG